MRYLQIDCVMLVSAVLARYAGRRLTGASKRKELHDDQPMRGVVAKEAGNDSCEAICSVLPDIM